MTRGRLTLAGVSLLAAAAIGGCGDGDSKSAGSASMNDGGAKSTHVNIADFKYKPATIDVAEGGSVTWENFDDAPHTATSKEGQGFDFDTGTLKQGKAKTVEFTKAGTYKYFCSFHPFMEADVVVK